MPIFLNAFTAGDLVLVRVNGLVLMGSRTRVRYIPPDDQPCDPNDATIPICFVCTVRAVKHFANQWFRYTQRKTKGRLLARLPLPDAVRARILSYAVCGMMTSSHFGASRPVKPPARPSA